MPIAITTKTRIPFRLKEDPDGTVFFIRPLSRRDVAEQPDDHRKIIDHYISRCLVGWENFKDQDGCLVAFDISKAFEALNAMDYGIIANEILRISGLDFTDRKNSESPPALP